MSAELAQSVGRVRPLANDCTVFVLTNAPIPIWRVERVNAADVFDVAVPLRRDAANRLENFVQAQAATTSTKELCDTARVSERTARRYRARLRVQGVPEARPQGGYTVFADALREILAAGDWVKTAEVIQRLAIPDRTGRNYLARYKEENGDRLEVARGKVRLDCPVLAV